MTSFPNIQTVEDALARSDRYAGRYRGAWYQIELKPSGFFFARINGQNSAVRDNLRDVLDAVYQKIERG